jgi:hypothetical protein
MLNNKYLKGYSLGNGIDARLYHRRLADAHIVVHVEFLTDKWYWGTFFMFTSEQNSQQSFINECPKVCDISNHEQQNHKLRSSFRASSKLQYFSGL